MRRCEIAVVGNNNFPVEGSDITFVLDGVPAGSVKNSRGGASILIPTVYKQLEITASFQSVSESIVLTPATTRATVVLSVPGAVIKSILPTAPTCPDGTTNQQCVDCIVNGTTIQICA
jgi:hypothetical protein